MNTIPFKTHWSHINKLDKDKQQSVRKLDCIRISIPIKYHLYLNKGQLKDKTNIMVSYYQEMAYSLYLTYPVIWLFFYNTIEKIQSKSSSCLSWHIQNVTYFEGDGVFVQQTGRASFGVSIEQCAQWCKVEYHQFFLTMLYTKRLLQNE